MAGTAGRRLTWRVLTDQHRGLLRTEAVEAEREPSTDRLTGWFKLPRRRHLAHSVPA